MDGRLFDQVTRALVAGGGSRRAVVKGAMGALLGVAGLRRASAQSCRGAGRLCNANGNCCSGICDTANPDPTKRNRCICPPGQENCRGNCVVCIAPATCSGGGTAGVCGCPTTSLTVQANNPNYTPTGVILPVGGQVQITASGITDVCGGNDPNCVSGPDGSIVNCGPFTCGTFIGKIGPGGTPFAVGDSLLLTASTAGELLLHVFDQPIPEFFADNSGFYSVTISCPS